MSARALIALLILASAAFGFTIVNECGASQSYVDAVLQALRESYDAYCRDIRCPALCPDFRVVLRDLKEYSGLAYSRSFPYPCTYRIDIACNLGGWLRPTVYHEMAHALQTAYADQIYGRGYGWWTEAHAEGLTSFYVAGDRWQYFGHVSRFWDRALYRRNPNSYTDWSVEWYQYGAFFAWLAWRYSPRNATEVYASELNSMMRAYLGFLLSPWDWGRLPSFGYGCDEEMDAHTAVYCVYGRALPGYVYVLSSGRQLINATVVGDELHVALAAPQKSTAGYTVTISRCENASTVTVTTTQTTTVTTTYTTTVPVTVTYTTTIPVTTTITTTVPVTTTVTQTVADNRTVTVTTTVNRTVTVPVTTTITVPVTSVTTIVVNRTVPITYTYTTTVTTTYNRTVTHVVREFDIESALIVALIAAALGCIACALARGRSWTS